jgi:translation initiation factor IF-2
VPVSALKKQGIDKLLEAIILQSEMMELKADPSKHGVGYVIESKMDIGKGALATVVIKNGSISVGDNFVVGTTMGKVRNMFDDKGNRLKIANPSDAVEIMGFNEVPEAGDKFYNVESEEYAKDIATKRQNLKKLEDSKTIKKLQMENAMQKLSSPSMKEFKVIVKADVQGSVEAIKHSLDKMVNNEIKVTVLHAAVGTVVESDVLLASTSAISSEVGVAILAFRVRVDSMLKTNRNPKASRFADSQLFTNCSIT